MESEENRYCSRKIRQLVREGRLLSEDWIPAIPGLNMEGNYADFAEDPMDWILTELEICRKFHPIYMKMIAPNNGAAMTNVWDRNHHH